jgi:cell division protein FtsQ
LELSANPVINEGSSGPSDLLNFSGKESGEQEVTSKRKTSKQNRRLSTSRQRRQQHLLDVKVRAHKASARRVQKAFFVFALMIILFSLVGGIVFGAHRVLRLVFFANPAYAMRIVEVTTDGELPRDGVLRAANISEGANIFSINLAAIEDRIRALPQVEEANVNRVLPDKLRITIHERSPVAWIASADANKAGFNYNTAYLVDRRGVVLKPKASAPEYMTLPVIIGVDPASVTVGQAIDQDSVKAALELIRDCGEVLQSRFQIATIDIMKDYALLVTDKQGSTVTFGLDELVLQLRRLQLLLSYCEQNSKDLQSANLMAERNIPVVFHEPPPPVGMPSTNEAQPVASPSAASPTDHPVPANRQGRKPARAGGLKNTHKKTNSAQTNLLNG